MSLASAASPAVLHPPAPSRVGGASIVRSRGFGGFSSLQGERFETRLRPHVHSTWVLGVIEDGAVEITAQGVRRLATRNSVIAIPPFVVHTEIPVTAFGWSFRYIYPSDRVVREILCTQFPGTSLALASIVLEDASLASLIRAFDDTLRNDGDAVNAEDALVRVIRAFAARNVGLESALPRARRNVRAVLSLMTERPKRTVTLDELSDAAGLSPFHFLRVFKAEVGLPPYAFFEQVRIAYANEMIIAGAHPSAVAYSLGYADQSHLTRHFHRGSFTTPGRLSRLATACTRDLHARTGTG